MKSKSLILLFVSLFVLFSCDDGIKFDNPLDENNRTSDSNDTEAETEGGNDKTDTESEYDDDKTDTASTNDEENQNRDDSDSGDTMPDDADSNDDSGDSVTNENTPDNDSADSVSDDDSDSAPENDDDTDSEPDEDEDEPVVVSVTTKCSNIPENAVYNTVDEITQTWNGEEWIPTNESYFSETPSTTECRFKCKSNYIWTGSQCALPTTPCDSNPCSGLANSNGSCTIAGSNYVCGCNTHYTWTGSLCKADEQTKPCTGKPENTSWNTASQIKQTWDGEEWYPSTTAVYNTNASTTECRYKCSTNYSWNSSNSTCVLTTQQGTCSAKPENTVWNDNGKNGKFDQIWNGSTYTPESYISTYNETAGTCRFKCASAEYTWNGSTCQLGSSGGSKSLGEICTGQDNCYDNSSEIACPTSSSADFYGQDAQYTSKCTAQSFSSSTNVVVDNNTGLTWEKSPSEGTYTWANRATHCTELNSSNYGGKSNWRVPNPLELLTIVDNSTYNPATNSNFTNMPSDSSVWFWTSAEYKGNTSYAYAFKPYFGNYFGYASDSYSKTKTYKVLCVSGDEMQPATSANFTTQTISGKVVVTDSKTGLMWQKDYATDKRWKEALKYCEDSSYAGYSDWRLPNKNELASLINYEKSGSPYSDFPDMPSSSFWSSSTDVYDTILARNVSFRYGHVSHDDKAYGYYVRCVRNESNSGNSNLNTGDTSGNQALSGKIGATCTEDSQCTQTYGGDDGQIAMCLLELSEGFPDGYCTFLGDDSDHAACDSTDELFYNFGGNYGGNGLCLHKCTKPSDCRENYRCSNKIKACLPNCKTDGYQCFLGVCDQTDGVCVKKD